jgi:hypothetical protein
LKQGADEFLDREIAESELAGRWTVSGRCISSWTRIRTAAA